MSDTTTRTTTIVDYLKLAIGTTFLIGIFLGPPVYIAYVLITRWGDPLFASHTVTETVYTGIMSDITWVLPIWLVALILVAVVYGPKRF